MTDEEQEKNEIEQASNKAKTEAKIKGKLEREAAVKNTAGSIDQSKVIEDKKVVTFQYKLYEIGQDGVQGELLEESTDNKPLRYLHGYNNVIPGLEDALQGKCQGDEVKVTLEPEQAYGLRRENALQRVPMKHLHSKPGKRKIRPGSLVSVQTDKGVRNVMVVKVGKFNVDVDTNHPLAGRTLLYEIKVGEVIDASDEEIAHGHSHGPGGHQH